MKKAGVVLFPGSNCDQDLVEGLSHSGFEKVVKIWHKQSDLENCDVVFLPGGFSYGDYLRSGAIARFSPIMKEVIGFASKGGHVVGICNGFQILTEAGLLPGALLRNKDKLFICDFTNLSAINFNTAITKSLSTDKVYKIPIAHGEGRYFAKESELDVLNENDQIIFKYVDESGNPSEMANPNGSLQNIAGVCNKQRNVFGMMPHPERVVDPRLGNSDGKHILASIRNYLA
jgi:phosphoribosylformylglycinamidine synthase I